MLDAASHGMRLRCARIIIVVFVNRIEWNAIVYAFRCSVVIISTALISVDYTKCDIISLDNGVKDCLQRLKDTASAHLASTTEAFVSCSRRSDDNFSFVFE